MHYQQRLLFRVFLSQIELNPLGFGWMLWKGMNSFRTFPFNHFSTMAAFMAIICFYVHKRITIQRLKMIRLLMRTVLTKSFFVHLVTFWRLFTCDQTKTHSHSLHLSGVRYLQNSVLDDATIANENGKNMNEKCPFDFFSCLKFISNFAQKHERTYKKYEPTFSQKVLLIIKLGIKF